MRGALLLTAVLLLSGCVFLDDTDAQQFPSISMTIQEEDEHLRYVIVKVQYGPLQWADVDILCGSHPVDSPDHETILAGQSLECGLEETLRLVHEPTELILYLHDPTDESEYVV